MNVPDHLAAALDAVDAAVHDNEHTQRPDWALDKTVRTVQVGNGRGVLDIRAGACRYCLADQAVGFGLEDAFETYLHTPPFPPRKPITEADVDAELEHRRARAEAEYEASMYDAYLSLDEYEAMGHANRAVYDLIANECGGHHANTPGLIDRIVEAVVRGRVEDAVTDVTRAETAEREHLRAVNPITGAFDVPLFTVEGDTP